MTAPPRLDFVVAGVQKAGTSTLDALLRRHPKIGMANVKETHFFDDEKRDWIRPDYEPLHAQLRESAEVRGEATPITFYWLPALHRLREYRRDMRLIVVFRDPIERALSHWRMQRAISNTGLSGAPELLDFVEAIDTPTRLRVLQGSEVPGHDRAMSYVERGRYGVQLRHALTVFPRDQMLLIDFEDLATKQQEVLTSVAAFLRIAPEPFAGPDLHQHRGVLTGRDDLTPDVDLRLAEEYADDLAVFESLSGLDTSRWRTRRLLEGRRSLTRKL